MNVNIPYIKTRNSNKLYCLPVSQLSDYILTEEEQQYIENLSENTNSIISSLKLAASTKAGSSLCTQPYLNTLYARRNDSAFSESSRDNFKIFMNSKLIGNEITSFPELAKE